MEKLSYQWLDTCNNNDSRVSDWNFFPDEDYPKIEQHDYGVHSYKTAMIYSAFLQHL